MSNTELLESSLIDGLHAALGLLPQISVSNPRRDVPDSKGTVDAKIDVRVAGKAYTLLIEAKKNTYPGDVHQMLWRRKSANTDRRSSKKANQTIWMLAADAISPGAKELLKAEGVGYYDRGGSLYLPASGAYIYIDKPSPKAAVRKLGSLFSGSRGQVLHALLQGYAQWFSTAELAKAADVSPATASLALAEMERLEWVDARGKGPHKRRHVRDPAIILDEWVKHLEGARVPVMERYFVPSLDADQPQETLGRVFAVHQASYAIGYEAAAQRYAPFISHVSQVRCRLMSGASGRAALKAMHARTVNEGANLAVLVVKSVGQMLFRQQIGSVWLSSPLQVYLDLQQSGGRAHEMAQHLRRIKLGY
jgi:hypothetical protein